MTLSVARVELDFTRADFAGFAIHEHEVHALEFSDFTDIVTGAGQLATARQRDFDGVEIRAVAYFHKEFPNGMRVNLTAEVTRPARPGTTMPRERTAHDHDKAERADMARTEIVQGAWKGEYCAVCGVRNFHASRAVCMECWTDIPLEVRDHLATIYEENKGLSRHTNRYRTELLCAIDTLRKRYTGGGESE